MEYYLLTFKSTHAAMAAQKHLDGKLSYMVCPILREISASCGISLRINNATYDEIIENMDKYPLGKEMYQIYIVTHEGIKEII